MTSSQPRTILIVGGSSGFGLSLTRHALKEGHKVIATSRSVSKAKAATPDIESQGGHWLELDIGSDNATAIVAAALKKYDVDAVVNSAAYAALGAFEDFTEQDWTQQYNVNVFGVMRVCKAVVPFFREKKRGAIVNIGSGAGIRGSPTRSMYSSTKFALAGFTESLAPELQPFGIKVILVEPGVFATNFGQSLAWPAQHTAAYDDTPAGEMMRKARSGQIITKTAGSADVAAARILEAITGQGLGAELGDDCVRMILGSDCLGALKSKIEMLNVALERNKNIAPSTDPKE